ncbi:YadA-like family protein [Proteus mirabilis]|uniref:YadA-like family protein n=1 Tax=Proteus mirabilis TaxID=584 RepID=UPI0018977942|nr:YadA-like family protein [Proteus mirabilis]MCT8244070.1 YadA-like family protein [Proteus mirabilis]MDF7249979.1 YadA-like family protein [Proteus mirabilis]MDF7408839.1 YadA-like family protein [Proteus mirabilis]MDF7434220.1 YadA-like family protein [Proteus mirabilis]HCQ8940101.1 YadA-like family protein [Proteus mirabilis]
MNNKLILSSILLTLSGVSLCSFAANPKGYSSIAIGADNTESSGIGSIAIGKGIGDATRSEQNFSVVIGPNSKSLNIPEKGGAGASVVIGYDSATEAGTFSTIVGSRSKIDSEGNYSTLIGNKASVTKLPENNSSLDVSGKKITVSADGHISVDSSVDPHAKEKYGNQYASSVMGYKSSSHNIEGTAVGSFSTVVGEFGTALGSQSLSIGSGSSAIGLESNSIGKNSIALGSYSASQETDSVSIGYLSESNSKGSIALGARSKTHNQYDDTVSKYTAVENTDSKNGVVSLGREATTTEPMINRRITNLAGGVNPTDAVNMSQLDVVTKAIGMSEDEIKNIEKDPSKSVVARINEEKKARTSAINEEKRLREQGDLNTLEMANKYTASSVDTLGKNFNKTLNDLQQKNEQRFSQMNKKIDRVEKRANAGIAGVTAISSIPYVNNERFSFGMGVGHYRDAQAIAAGVQYKVSQNANIRVNTSWNNGGDTNLGAGFAIGW